MNGDRLRLDLTRLAEEVTPVDLRDRVLRTSRRIGIQRAVATSATALVLLGAAAGTAFALTPRAGTPSPAGSGSAVVAPSGRPTATPPTPSTVASRSGAPVATDESANPTSAPVDDALYATGIGPYRIGADLVGLQSQGLLTDVQIGSVCPGVGARGLAAYHKPHLSFHDGRLTLLIVDSPQARTAAGAGLGMTLAQIKGRHPDGRQLTRLGRYVWLTSEGRYALMFRFDDGGRVNGIEAGPAEAVAFRFTDGEGC